MFKRLWNLLTGILSSTLRLFEAANPNIDVEPLFIANAEYEDKVRTLIVSGLAPDVFRFDQQRFAGFAHDGAFLDLSQFIKRDWQALNLDDIVPGLLDMWKYNGRYLGMPFDFNPVLISYNTAALAQAGLTPPKRAESGVGASDRYLPVRKPPASGL